MKFNFTSNEESLMLNGKKIAKVWMIEYDSTTTRVSIVNVYSPRDRLIDKAHINEISVNGVAYSDCHKLTHVLTDLLFIDGGTDGSNGGSENVTIKTDYFSSSESNISTKDTAVYTLSTPPNSIISIGMNGIKQPSDCFTNEGTALTIIQSKLPVNIESGDEIEVTYNY